MIQSWYCYAKTEVEEQALNFTERTGLDVVSICRTLVLGPILQSTTNASSLFLINLLKGTHCYQILIMCHASYCHELILKSFVMLFIASFLFVWIEGCDTLENEHCQINRIVDVRDVADAILLAYENHEAERRYICTSHAIKDRDFFPVSSSILSWMITICVFLFYMQFACWVNNYVQVLKSLKLVVVFHLVSIKFEFIILHSLNIRKAWKKSSFIKQMFNLYMNH
jgi:hypothetical protein